MKRKKQINFPVNEEEDEAIKAAAEAANMSTAAFCRFILGYVSGLGLSVKDQLKRAERAMPWEFTE